MTEWPTCYHWPSDKTITIDYALKQRKNGDLRAGDLHCHAECFKHKPRTGTRLFPRDRKSCPHFWKGSGRGRTRNANCRIDGIRKSKSETHRFAQFYHDLRYWLKTDAAKKALQISTIIESKSMHADFTLIHEGSKTVDWDKTDILITDKNRKRIPKGEYTISIELNQWVPEHLADFQRYGVRKIKQEWKQLVARIEAKKNRDARAVAREKKQRDNEKKKADAKKKVDAKKKADAKADAEKLRRKKDADKAEKDALASPFVEKLRTMASCKVSFDVSVLEQFRSAMGDEYSIQSHFSDKELVSLFTLGLQDGEWLSDYCEGWHKLTTKMSNKKLKEIEQYLVDMIEHIKDPPDEEWSNIYRSGRSQQIRWARMKCFHAYIPSGTDAEYWKPRLIELFLEHLAPAFTERTFREVNVKGGGMDSLDTMIRGVFAATLGLGNQNLIKYYGDPTIIPPDPLHEISKLIVPRRRLSAVTECRTWAEKSYSVGFGVRMRFTRKKTQKIDEKYQLLLNEVKRIRREGL